MCEIAGSCLGESHEEVSGSPAEADDHAAVLEPAVRIEQPGSDRARRRDVRPGCTECVEPTAGAGLDVVVQEDQHVTRASAAAALFSSAQLNGPVVAKHADVGPFSRRSSNVCVSGCTDPLSTSTNSGTRHASVRSIDSMQVRRKRGSSRNGMMMVADVTRPGGSAVLERCP